MAETVRAQGRTRTVTATEARVHFGEMLRAVNDGGEDVIIERSGTPEGVLISMADYQELRRLHPKPEKNWAEEMMKIHEEIAAHWVGPGLTAEDVDDAINFGQR